MFIMGFMLLVGQSEAQNVGYTGKKYVLGLGVLVTNTTLTRPTLQLNIEHSVSKHRSISLALSSRRFDWAYQNDIFITSLNDIYNGPIRRNNIRFNEPITGNVKGHVETVDLGLRTYSFKRGSIAPFGLFVETGVRISSIRLSESQVQTVGSYFDNEQVVVQLNYDPENAVSYDLGVYVAMGEKRYLPNETYLEYRIYADVNGLGGRPGDYQSHMKAAHAMTKNYVLARSLIGLSFSYGLGF